MKPCRLVASLLWIGSLATGPCALGEESGGVSIRYVYQRDGSHDEFYASSKGDGSFQWFSYLSKEALKREGLWEDFSGSQLHDCSDEVYRCLVGSFTVFAVPRSGLMPQSTYVAGGAFHRVQQCLVEREGRCERALISSECRQRVVATEGCTAAMPALASDEDPGPVGYFIFDQADGVTSYGQVSKLVKSSKKKLTIAQEYRLDSPKGLLAPDALVPTP